MTYSRRPFASLWTITLLIVFLLGYGAHPVLAQADDPWSAADTVRRTLFSAQALLLGSDSTGAAVQVTQAASIYTQSLQAPIRTAAPEVALSLDEALKAALAAAQKGDALNLAAARSRVWTGLLHGSARVVVKSVEGGDAAAARQWLQLRDFRVATKFSRPDADSTLAVKALAAGQKSAADILPVVRADLLDTYQAKLNAALVEADNAQQKNFAEKQAEQSALAAGYFDLLTDNTLSSAYLTLRGADTLAASRAAFTTLVNATLRSETANYREARGTIDAALKGFRAAPLSEAEQARRAGQLSRFVALVSVEYGRGVSNGQVIRDIEVQEALTFREGASAAFADLQSILEARDPAATAKVAKLLSTLKTQILATAAPSSIDSMVNEITTTLKALYPASWQAFNSGSDFDVINSILDQIEPAVKQGQYNLAESARLEAYAILDSGIEQKLRGFAPELALRVESLFWQGDAKQPGLAVLITGNAPVAEVKAGITALRAALAESQTFLGGAKTASGAVVGNAAVIVFREGLEAVLILASLVAGMRTVDSRKHRRAIMAGAVLALLASALTWWIANGLLMSMMQYGEKLAAALGVVAIAVLLLITNWFFHKTYWTGWMANFHKQKSRILGGTLVVGPSAGLVILGFTSIYREGFETVLFLQSLVLDSGLVTVLEGVALGLVGTAIVGVITFALQVRLPYKRMLIITGIFIGVVLLTMVGNTVHAMQSVGWMPITPIAGLYFPFWVSQWFGLFATWQGIILQVAAGVFVIGSYFAAEYMNHQKRSESARKPLEPSAEGFTSVSSGLS